MTARSSPCWPPSSAPALRRLATIFFLYLTRPDREPDAEPLVPALPVDRYIQQLRDAKRKAALREATRVLDRVRSGAHRV
jgi:hypothetical protein